MTIDTNAHLGHWPFRRHGFEETSRFVTKLRAVKVEEAWVASFDGVLHKDVASANARLAAECGDHGGGLLVPFGTVNPRLPDWPEDLRRCHELHRMPGVRLYPNYHGYPLDDSEFSRLLKLAAEAKLLVQVVVKMEDERTHHPLVKVPAVELGPLAKVVATAPRLKLQILNCPLSPVGEGLVPLARAGNVSFDIAMQEGVGVVAGLVDRVGADRVLFGTHFPLFHTESSALKLKEAGLAAEVETRIRSGNARALFAKR
ncbi:MAG TPA: amidohydrolase family protein [Gemmataceae bacterium]|nr:amidohydrolase family protein [Gemmataceae bacterium]